jgi:probable rRNA maturation factor
VAAAALDAAMAPPPASLGLILAGDEDLATLNAEHMGHEGSTDVLSFPLLPPDAFPPHVGQAGAQGKSAPFALPPGRRLHLGDVVVSVERAVAQAAAGAGGQAGNVRWSAADELRLLVVHGTLHVCGWDHARPEEEAQMRALERQILEEAR